MVLSTHIPQTSAPPQATCGSLGAHSAYKTQEGAANNFTDSHLSFMRLSRLFGRPPSLEDVSEDLIQDSVHVGSSGSSLGLPSYEEAVGHSKDEQANCKNVVGKKDGVIWKGQCHEDELTVLKEFKVVIIVDDSGSMNLPASSGHSASPSLSRWKIVSLDNLVDLIAILTPRFRLRRPLVNWWKLPSNIAKMDLTSTS